MEVANNVVGDIDFRVTRKDLNVLCFVETASALNR